MKRSWALLLLALVAPFASAGESPADEPADTAPDTADTPTDPVMVPVFAVVDDLFQPGEAQHSGDDWLALRCSGAECSLVPARLKATPHVERRNGAEPLRGQRLVFVASAGNGVVLAWLQLHADLPWLKAGAVPTYASTEHLPDRPPTSGSFEWSIPLPDGSRALLVPVEGVPATLQLRASGKRQFLDELARCGKELSASYFRWAGDLDGDGLPDYLVATLSGPSSARLHLSSAATNEALVDDSLGRSLATPIDEECE